MVTCPVCGHEVDWLTLGQVAKILEVSPTRVSQFIKAGRLPGAQKHRPHYGIQPLWKVPIKSVMAFHEMRQKEYGYVR